MIEEGRHQGRFETGGQGRLGGPTECDVYDVQVRAQIPQH